MAKSAKTPGRKPGKGNAAAVYLVPVESELGVPVTMAVITTDRRAARKMLREEGYTPVGDGERKLGMKRSRIVGAVAAMAVVSG